MSAEPLRSRCKRTAKRFVLGNVPSVFWTWQLIRHGREKFEPESRLLKHLADPGRASVDVGANYGVFTHDLIAHSAHVHAFEPLPELASLLRRTFRGQVDSVSIHEIALSDREGVATLRSPAGLPGRSTVDPHNLLTVDVPSGRLIRSYEVQCRRLDECGLTEIGFIKIDVEGHEMEVLRGASRILLQERPSLLIELEERHRRGSIGAASAYLSDRGYSGYFLRRNGLSPIVDLDPDVHQNPSRPSTYVRNFVFVHQDRAADVAAIG